METDNMIKKRGRPRKVKLSLDDQLEETILKAYDVSVKSDGSLQFKRNATLLTLDEVALLLWASEGRKSPKPMTKMNVIKIERNALDKMRNGLKKYGIKSLDDVLDLGKGRVAVASKYGATDCPE